MNPYLLEFLVGLGLSYVLSLPPGMISLNVLQITISRGIKAAFVLALAAVLVEAVQAFIGTKFSEWIIRHEQFERALHIFVIPVFLVFGIFNVAVGIRLLRSKKKISDTPPRVIGTFWRGMLVSALNPIAIPFWVVWSTSLSEKKMLVMETGHILVFVLGTTIGTLACLMTYAYLSALISKRLHSVKIWMNLVVGILFLGLAALQIVHLLVKK